MRQWAKTIKRDVIALYLAARDPRTPWFARASALLVAGYALSPIDLIPDFIPILGYLDEIVLLPIAIALIVRMIPPDLFCEYRIAATNIAERPISRVAAATIVLIWLSAAALVLWLALH